jgi:hypothetical protein
MTRLLTLLALLGALGGCSPDGLERAVDFMGARDWSPDVVTTCSQHGSRVTCW